MNSSTANQKFWVIPARQNPGVERSQSGPVLSNTDHFAIVQPREFSRSWNHPKFLICSTSVKAIIFDCDGTLVDSEHSHYLSWREVLQKRGYLLTHEDHHFYTGKSDLICAHLFASKIQSDPEGVNKPKPYIYLHAAKLLSLAPEQCIAVEDSHTAVSAGCIAVAVPNSFTYHHDLSQATLKIDSLAGLSVEAFLQLANKGK